MNIIDAIEDSNLFRPFLADGRDSLDTWKAWMTALRAVYGLPIVGKKQRQLFTECTGRMKPRKKGYGTSLFVTGRRSGKSREAAIIGAYEAALAGHANQLSRGEKGVVLIASPTKAQSRIVHDYCRGIFEAPMLTREVVRETNTGFELRNNIRIEILPGDWRTVRGYTLICAIVDELAFFGYDSDSKVKSDTELVRALKPSLATTGGKLICISSPYAERGWLFKQFQKHHGNDKTYTMVWKCPSRTMNPTLPQSVVDEALEEDVASARAEYLGEFRSDVATWLPREVIQACVKKNRKHLSPDSRHTYAAFVDISGGRNDDASLGIAHRDEDSEKIVIDYVGRWRPPFSPDAVCGEMAEVLDSYGVSRVTGDRYGAEFTRQAFRCRGISYNKSHRNAFGRNPVLKSKSELYLDLLPRLCAREVELPDNGLLVDQLAGLERKTRSGGKDSVDHGPNGHDDVANAVAGVVDCAAKPKRKLGRLFPESSESDTNMRLMLRRRRAWANGRHPGNGQPIAELGNPRSYF